jgi:hypothetical protein
MLSLFVTHNYTESFFIFSSVLMGDLDYINLKIYNNAMKAIMKRFPSSNSGGHISSLQSIKDI